MDPWKYFDLGHRDHAILNPTSPARLDELIGLLDLPDGGRALDIACGKAEPHPDDPDVPALLARSREQRDAYLRWGRDTLGWAMYLFAVQPGV